MTKTRRLIRAIHAGLVCWLVNSILGFLAVSIVPESWILQNRSKFALVVHHVVPIIVVNFLIAVAFAFVIKLLLEYQHQLDLQETTRNEK